MGLSLDLGNLVCHLQLDVDQLKRETTEIKRELEGTNKAMTGFARSMSTTFKAALAYFSFREIIRGFKEVTAIAMEAEKANRIFLSAMGTQAKEAGKWIDQLAASSGRCEDDLRKMSAVMMMTVTGLGVGREDALQMAEGLTKLSVAISTVYHISQEEAFQKVRAGMAGMGRGLQELGIIIKNTNDEQYALDKGWIRSGDTLSESGKAYVRYNKLLDETRDLMKQVAESQNDAWNTGVALDTAWEDMKKTLGTRLLPVVILLKGDLVELFKSTWIQRWVADIVEGVSTVVEAFIWLDHIIRGIGKVQPMPKAYLETARKEYQQITGDVSAFKQILQQGMEGPMGYMELPPKYTAKWQQIIAMYQTKWEKEQSETVETQMRHLKERATALGEAMPSYVYPGNANVPTFVEALLGDSVYPGRNQPNTNVPNAAVPSPRLPPPSREEMTVQLTADQILQTRANMYGQIERMGKEGYEMQKQLIEQERDTYIRNLHEEVTAKAWAMEQMEKLDIEYLKSTDNLANGFKAAGMQIRREMQTWGEKAYEFTMSMAQSFENGLMNMLQNAKNWGDAVKGMLREIVLEAARIAFIQPMTQQLAGSFAGAFGSLGGMLGGGAVASTGVSAGFQSDFGMEGFAEGGIAWRPQIASLAENGPELITPLAKLDSVGLSGASGKEIAAGIKELIYLTRRQKIVQPVVIDRREDMAALMQRDYLRRGKLTRSMR
jgi:hypothetical protein